MKYREFLGLFPYLYGKETSVLMTYSRSDSELFSEFWDGEFYRSASIQCEVTGWNRKIEQIVLSSSDVLSQHELVLSDGLDWDQEISLELIDDILWLHCPTWDDAEIGYKNIAYNGNAFICFHNYHYSPDGVAIFFDEYATELLAIAADMAIAFDKPVTLSCQGNKDLYINAGNFIAWVGKDHVESRASYFNVGIDEIALKYLLAYPGEKVNIYFDKYEGMYAVTRPGHTATVRGRLYDPACSIIPQLDPCHADAYCDSYFVNRYEMELFEPILERSGEIVLYRDVARHTWLKGESCLYKCLDAIQIDKYEHISGSMPLASLWAKRVEQKLDLIDYYVNQEDWRLSYADQLEQSIADINCILLDVVNDAVADEEKSDDCVKDTSLLDEILDVTNRAKDLINAYYNMDEFTFDSSQPEEYRRVDIPQDLILEIEILLRKLEYLTTGTDDCLIVEESP